MPDDELASCTTLAVLAGGEGSRMGRPKGLLEIAGRPILAHLLERFAWPGRTLLVTAPGRESPPGWEMFDAEAVDPIAGEGPLRGVHTGLAAATTELVVIAVVDMPQVGRTQVEWLNGLLAGIPSAAAVMLRRGETIEPFPLACRRDLALPLVAELLASGRRAVHGLAALPGVRVVQPPEDWHASVWKNLNEPGDLDPAGGYRM